MTPISPKCSFQKINVRLPCTDPENSGTGQSPIRGAPAAGFPGIFSFAGTSERVAAVRGHRPPAPHHNLFPTGRLVGGVRRSERGPATAHALPEAATDQRTSVQEESYPGAVRERGTVSVEHPEHQHVRPPTAPPAASKTYPSAPRAASGMGNTHDRLECRMRSLPPGENGAHPMANTPTWYSARYPAMPPPIARPMRGKRCNQSEGL